mmetsp:Transcript_88856/g.177691  ORF Transcript_88856/g.177691 Transcript_88856/m.177691 type:complete len:229 (-) Transcript_88856:227-913(-)
MEWTWSLEYEDGDRWDTVPATKIRTEDVGRGGSATGATAEKSGSSTPGGGTAESDTHAGTRASAMEVEARPANIPRVAAGLLRYDLILGADLLFFESHNALAACLDRLLVDRTDDDDDDDGGDGGGEGGADGVARGGGTVLLCQPSRNGTMEAFASHPDVLRLFVVERFDCDGQKKKEKEGASESGGGVAGGLGPEVAVLHEAYLLDPNFSPNIHSPSILRLRRRRRA